MKPAPPDTAELLHRVRQQLILAQVRLMELEDDREELGSKLADTEKLLGGAQVLADQKTDEAGHIAKVHADLQAQYDYMRHIQHVTNEALNEARLQLAATAERLAASEKRGNQLQKEIVTLADQAVLLTRNISQLSLGLAEANATAAARLARINELDGELHAMKASPSWRWTKWLRSLERTFGGRKS